MLKMKATLAKVENGQAHLEVEVDPAEVEAALGEAYQKVVRRVNIPGFRKGKAPRFVLERHVGRDALMREALDILLPHAFHHAVEDTRIEPVGEPHFDVEGVVEGAPLAFRVAVEVKPQVKLGDYRSISVPYEVPEIGEEEVDRFLADLQDRNARLVTIEDGEAAPGLFAWVSYDGTVAGRAVNSGGQAQLLDLSSADLLPGLGERLAGAKAGEEREVSLAYPENDERLDLAGKSADLKIRVHAVARKELPALDDELARSLGSGSVEELRLEAKNKLTQAVRERADEQTAARAVEALVAGAEVEAIPASMINRRMRSLFSEWMRQLKQMGMTPETYLAQLDVAAEAFEAQVRARAERELRTELVLEHLARQEGITASEEEVRQGLDKAGLTPSAAPMVSRSIAMAKAATFLGEIAKSPAALPQSS